MHPWLLDFCSVGMVGMKSGLDDGSAGLELKGWRVMAWLYADSARYEKPY